MVPSKQLETLEEIYFDAKKCASVIGLSYTRFNLKKGFFRVKKGRGFSFQDPSGAVITDEKCTVRFQALGIPPNWQEVWVSPQEKGHIQAVGWDTSKRKQYIYHTRWREYRELLNSYRMIIFGKNLPKLREKIKADSKLKGFPMEKVIAGILLLLDKTYIRIGNDIYFEERKSVGLTTMRKKNITIEGNLIRFKYLGKSGKKATVEIEDHFLAKFLTELMELPGAQVFTAIASDGNIRKISSSDVNRYLKEASGQNIRAKDFRTWGGTLTAFSQLVAELENLEKKPEKAVIKALDAAAETLGNTRSVVKNTYVHPDLIKISTEGKFPEYYEKVKRVASREYLSEEESQLLKFLQLLFENEFDFLKL